MLLTTIKFAHKENVLKNDEQSKNAVKQSAWICNQRPLIIHRENPHKQLGSGHATPQNGHRGHYKTKQTLE